MGDNTRVAWTEGMFLRPQHFQQSDKHFSNLINQLCNGNLSDPWGIIDISIDTQLLNSGQFALESLSAITSDLLPIEMPQSTPLPEPLVVSKDVYDEVVYLAIPAIKNSGINISALDENIVTRYKLNDLAVSDDSLGAQSQEV
eukprot:UN25566